MPSVAATPLQLVVTGGGVRTTPARETVAKLRLVVSMGEVEAGPGTDISSTVTRPVLDRLTDYDKPEFMDPAIWLRQMSTHQQNVESIEGAFEALSNQVDNLSTLVREIRAAQKLAQAANDTANDTRTKQDLADSYTDPTEVATFANDGTITIAAHSRVYPISGAVVSVDAGSVSGFPEGAYVTVYYNDPGHEGGAVSYLGTTDAVAQTDGKHIVASGSIPAAGSPPASGGGPTGPGYTPPPGGGGGDGTYLP